MKLETAEKYKWQEINSQLNNEGRLCIPVQFRKIMGLKKNQVFKVSLAYDAYGNYRLICDPVKEVENETD